MLVSVIIPCYNVEKYISECIESVSNQSYNDIEIICIDNNSSDNTVAILNDLKLKFSNLVVDKELKPGAPAARNKGLELAGGQWIQFLDADDLLLPTKIAHQIKMINDSLSPVDFVTSSYIKRTVNHEDTINLIKLPATPSNYYISAFTNQSGITSSNLWNKNALIEVGNWDENIKSSQETDLMLRLVLNNKQYIVDIEPLTIIRERETGQISQRNPEKKWKQYIDVRLDFLDQLRSKLPNEYLKLKGMCYDFLMISVITLGKYDKKGATEYYEKHIKNEWNSSYAFGFSKFKVKLIKLFGIRILLMK